VHAVEPNELLAGAAQRSARSAEEPDDLNARIELTQ
jgi:hypothetical protein